MNLSMADPVAGKVRFAVAHALPRRRDGMVAGSWV
jgi:hypothetical protein